MLLEATPETGGCERLFSRVVDRKDRVWSAVLVPRVGQTTLRSLGTVEDTPSAPVIQFLRHPYNRLVSAWRYLPTLEPWKDWPDWPELVALLMDSEPDTLDRHLRPQSWFTRGVEVVTYTGLRNLTPLLGPGRENSTPYDRSWPRHDEAIYQQVIDYYADDMALFLDAERIIDPPVCHDP